MRKLLFFLLTLVVSAESWAQYSMCGGTSTVINAASLGFTINPITNYVLNPGNNPSSNGTFTVSPGLTTTYTVVASNGSTTQALPVTVTVFPQPNVSPTYTQLTCNTTTNAFNMGLTFNPATSPSYTIDWSNAGMGPPIIPTGWTQPQTSLSGSIAAGNYTARVTGDGGCQIIFVLTMSPAPAPATFVLNPNLTTFSLTCVQQTQTISVNNPTLSYNWENPITVPSTATEVAISYLDDGNTWTVTATNPNSGCVFTRTFAVGVNTLAPVATISPSHQAITCAAPTPTNILMTAVNPTINFTHLILSPGGSTFVANTQTALMQPPPGTHTYIFVNNVTGCRATREFSVETTGGFPTFTLTYSSTTPTLGCSTKSCFTAFFADAQTHPVGGGAVTYTIIPPSGGAPPSGTLSLSQNYTLCTPGTWTAIVRDKNTGCSTNVPFSVLNQNNGPALDTLELTRAYAGGEGYVDCTTPTVTLHAFNFTEGLNVGYQWNFPGTPGVQLGPVITASADLLAPTKTLVANYTLTMTDPGNLCITRTVIPIYQNTFKPNTSFTSGGSTSLTCKTSSIMLTNQSSTGIPPGGLFPRNQQVVGYLWEGPTPQLPLQISTSYVAKIPGIYTLTARDNNNGCMGTNTLVIREDKLEPIVQPPANPAETLIECGASSVVIRPVIPTGTANLTYSWVATSSVQSSNGFTNSTFMPNVATVFTVVVTNTLNGCATTTFMSSGVDTLDASFEISEPFGYAPHDVIFINNSSSRRNNANITTVWSWGDGTWDTTRSVTRQPTKVYQQPGTYTITAFVFKGACSDTTKRVITVEVPSRLTIPNIFTPNGDGINDIYFLNTANLSEIDVEIFDRWGHRVYQVISTKGNIAWDGLNNASKECPDGVYMYVIRAKGRDGQDYNEKGMITIVR